MLRNIFRSLIMTDKVRVVGQFRPLTIAAQNLSSGSENQFQVEHDARNKKFMLNIDHDSIAYLNYEILGNNEVLLYHTDVPERFSGRGIGRVLAKEAFKYFNESKQTMVITCPYLQKVQSQIQQ